MGRVREEERQEEESERTWDPWCLEADRTDCTICLYDVLWIVSWVHLLAGEALFGAQSSCQGMRKACSLQTADRPTETCRHRELSNPSPLSLTKQSKIRDKEEEIVCQSRLDGRKTKFSSLSLIALCCLFRRVQWTARPKAAIWCFVLLRYAFTQ